MRKPVIWRLYFNKLTKLNIQFLNKAPYNKSSQQLRIWWLCHLWFSEVCSTLSSVYVYVADKKIPKLIDLLVKTAFIFWKLEKKSNMYYIFDMKKLKH